MMPFLEDGEIIYFKKYINLKCNLKVGQIVIFYHPINNQKQIKRITQVKDNCIEVIGDNRELSKDSRSYGLIQKEKIIGIFTSKVLNLKLKKSSKSKKEQYFSPPKISP